MTQGSFKCKKGDIINSNHSWVVEVLVYDDNGICLEQLSINKTYTVVSENATQFTVQGTTQDILSTLMITVNNDMPSVYTPYSKNLIDKVNDIDAQFKLSQKYLQKPFVVLSFDAFNLTDNRFKIVNDEYGYKATVANTTNEDIFICGISYCCFIAVFIIYNLKTIVSKIESIKRKHNKRLLQILL